MEATINHTVTFTTKGDVPVGVVAKSLLSNERLVHESVRLVEQLYPALTVPKIRVKVSELSNASPLKELFAVGLFITWQEELEREVPEFILALTGLNIPENMETLITVGVMLVASHIVAELIERAFPGKSIKALKADMEHKIKELSNMTHLSEEEICEALDARYSGGKAKTLFKKSLDFFLPAKIERGVEIQSRNGIGISKEAIDDIPGDVDWSMVDSIQSYELESAVVEIHRSDRDEYKYGWRAVVEDVSDRKVRMELSPNISPATLYGYTSVVGDVLVVEERQDDGEFIPKTYHLLNVKTLHEDTKRS